MFLLDPNGIKIEVNIWEKKASTRAADVDQDLHAFLAMQALEAVAHAAGSNGIVSTQPSSG